MLEIIVMDVKYVTVIYSEKKLEICVSVWQVKIFLIKFIE